MYMKDKESVLTREERDVLMLGGIQANDIQLSNAEIGQRLGLPVNKVKTIIHQACIKLKAHNRNEAIHFAIIRGELNIDELFSLDDLAQRFGALHPDIFRMLARRVRQGLEPGCPAWEGELIVPPDKGHETLLTKAEREVVILAGLGLSNKEIADRLHISSSAARIFLYRAGIKLGATRRAEAVVLAIKRREITALDIFPPPELFHILVRLGADTLDKVAELLDERVKGEPVQVGG